MAALLLLGSTHISPWPLREVSTMADKCCGPQSPAPRMPQVEGRHGGWGAAFLIRPSGLKKLEDMNEGCGWRAFLERGLKWTQQEAYWLFWGFWEGKKPPFFLEEEGGYASCREPSTLEALPLYMYLNMAASSF